MAVTVAQRGHVTRRLEAGDVASGLVDTVPVDNQKRALRMDDDEIADTRAHNQPFFHGSNQGHRQAKCVPAG